MNKKRYLFRIELAGIGEDIEEAWGYALESFVQDPGTPPDVGLDHDDEGFAMDAASIDETWEDA